MDALKKRNLPGVEGLRALAALAVLLWHVDRFSFFFGLAPMGYGKTSLAESAVTLFFVLSGYLITLLLFDEKSRRGSIDVRRFYLRRFLRIAPPYYLVLIASLPLAFYLTYFLPVKSYVLYSLMLPNVAYAWGLGLAFLFPLWSVGVEVQFYLVWPWLARRSIAVLKVLIKVAILYFLVKIGLRLLENGPIYRFWRLTAFDSFAVGGVSAYLVHQGHSSLDWICKKEMQLLAWGAVLVGVLFAPVSVSSLIDSEIHACIYAILVINVTSNPATILRLENPFLKYLGRISYGLYLYHLPVMAFLGKALPGLFDSINESLWRPVFASCLVLVASVAVASVSYHLVEAPILLYKKKARR